MLGADAAGAAAGAAGAAELQGMQMCYSLQAGPPMTSQRQTECKTYDAAGWLAAGAAASELGACAQTCGVRDMLGLSDK